MPRLDLVKHLLVDVVLPVQVPLGQLPLEVERCVSHTSSQSDKLTLLFDLVDFELINFR